MSQLETNQWDTLIRNATIIDGSGELPEVADLAIKDGKIAARGVQLSGSAVKEIDAQGLWLTPGLLDIHTHFDLEVELAPGLPEAVRHGSTTVVVANCSLGLAFGAQRKDGADPIVDCFARVENIPKPVLTKVADCVDWHDSKAYLDHLNSLPLGVNIVPLIPHSMLRIEAMGFQESISRDPTSEELDTMSGLLEQAMEQGYVGFSTDGLPYHYLANTPNQKRKIPTQYGTYKELKQLTRVLREHDRVWQATPPKDNKFETFRNFLLTSGRLHGKTLKVTSVAALDVAANKSLLSMVMTLVRLLNSKLLKGNFAIQALAAPFKVWGEGPITPIFEEVDELRSLIELDLEDREGRQQILKDEQFIKDFVAMWDKGKSGFSVARIKRWLTREDFAFSRNLNEMVIDRCPVEQWSGMNLREVFDRVQAYQSNSYQSNDQAEQQALDSMPDKLHSEGRFLVELLKQFDTDLYWYSVFANRDHEKMLNTLLHPKILPGFNDSGAHLTNMAFYDANLRGLKATFERGMDKIPYLVKRLTRDPADFFSIDAGRIDLGCRADVVLIDPKQLAEYDSEEKTESVYRPEFEHHQLVNRSDGVIPYVFVAGHLAWENCDFTADHGKQAWGSALTAVA